MEEAQGAPGVASKRAQKPREWINTPKSSARKGIYQTVRLEVLSYEF